MKKISFKTWISNIQLVALRFPFTLFFLLGLSFYFFFKINNHNADIQPRLWAFLSIGITLSIAVTLFSEALRNVFVRIGLNLLAIILLLIYVFTLPEKLLPFNYYQLVILGLVFVLFAFVVSFFRKNNDIPFWEFSKTSIIQLVISFIFAQVLMVGLSLAVLSLQKLFKVDIQFEVYQNLAVICYALFAPIYFLAAIPAETEKYKQEYTFHKFLKILGLYILLPILVVYLLILYVYLVQIVVKWELPNGWVSMLVSVLGLGGFLCILILYPLRLENKSKIVNLLAKYFPLLLFPLLVLMSIGIFRRLGDYGLTINRCYVLILNLWLYGICIYLFLSKANHLKWIIISFASVTFLFSVGPWSVFSVTKRTLAKEIGQLLAEAKLLKDGKVIDNSNKTIKVEVSLANKLSEKINYISDNFSNESLQSLFSESIHKKTSWDLNKKLGINDIQVKDSFFTAWLRKSENAIVNVQGYRTLLNIQTFDNKTDTILSNNQFDVFFKNYQILVVTKSTNSSMLSIPLKDKLKAMIESPEVDNTYTKEAMTLRNENYKLIITSVNGQYFLKNDSIRLTSFEAQLFLK